jgi:hypothetical protein
MLELKFMRMDEIGVEYQFIYNELLTLFRGCHTILLSDEENTEEQQFDKMEIIFHTLIVPLVAKGGFRAFKDQYSFAMIEIGNRNSEKSMKIYMQHAFSYAHQQNCFYRDLTTIESLAEMLSELEINGKFIPVIIRFLFDAATQMRIRPRLQEDLIRCFFAESGLFHSTFNTENGEFKREVDISLLAWHEITLGLRRMFSALWGLEMYSSTLFHIHLL